MSATRLRLATRTSPLARFQTDLVARRLAEVHGHIDIEIVGVQSAGDKDQRAPIREFSGKGAFTTAVDQEVRDRRADVSVHSAKDLPASADDDDLVLACVPTRADPRDVLVGSRLAELAPGAVVATGSIRRRTQLSFVRPDLGFVELRGNIASRLSKIPPGGAIVMAKAAIERLGIEIAAHEVLEPAIMLPQVGQGAIALRCRQDDALTSELLGAIDDPIAHRCVRAERAFLRAIGGGCDAPIGAYAICADDGTLSIEGLIARRDGHALARAKKVGDEPERLGAALARELIERCGGPAFVDAVQS